MRPAIQHKKPFGILFAKPDALASTDAQLGMLVPIPDAELHCTLPEQYDLAPLAAWRGNSAIEKANNALRVSCFLAQAKRSKAKRLGMFNEVEDARLEERARKINHLKECMDVYLNKVQ